MAVRPAKCHFCRKQMYYVNEVRHLPEYRVEILEHSKQVSYFYCHQACWRVHMGHGNLDDILGLE